MHIHLNDQDISKIQDLLDSVSALLERVNDSQSDKATNKRKLIGISQVKQKVIKKRNNNHINSSEVSINSWKCERWNLTGWTVTRQK